MGERLIPTTLIVGAKPIQSRYPGLSGQLWQWQEVVPAPLQQELQGVVTGDCRNWETGRQHFAPYVS